MASSSSLTACLFASPPRPSESMYAPRPARCFAPHRIILAKGSTTTLQRQRLAEAICRAYPKAGIEERLNVHHNKIDLGVTDRLGLPGSCRGHADHPYRPLARGVRDVPA